MSDHHERIRTFLKITNNMKSTAYIDEMNEADGYMPTLGDLRMLLYAHDQYKTLFEESLKQLDERKQS